jgi:hypothetical protein
VAAEIGGRLHLIGGRDPGGDTGRHDVYDPVGDTWTTAAPMPTPRDHATGAVLDGALHVAAGRPGGMSVHEVYDPAADSWHTAAPLPTGRNSVAGAVLNGRFLVLGGEDGGEQQVYSEVEAYDPGTDTWTALAPLPQPMQGTGAVVTGGRLFLPGGGPGAGGTAQSTLLQVLTVPHPQGQSPDRVTG